MNEFLTALGIASPVCAIVFGYAIFYRNRKKDDNEEGKATGAIMTELGYIKSGVDDVKAEQREQRKTNMDFVSRLTDVEASAKQAHKRIDHIEKLQGEGRRE